MCVKENVVVIVRQMMMMLEVECAYETGEGKRERSMLKKRKYRFRLIGTGKEMHIALKIDYISQTQMNNKFIMMIDSNYSKMMYSFFDY